MKDILQGLLILISREIQTKLKKEKNIYNNIYAPFAPKNKFQDLEAKIDNQKFNEEIINFL